MKSAILLLAALFVSATARAEKLLEVEETKQLCQRAAEAFGKGNAKQSIEILKPHWPLPAEELDNLVYTTQSQLNMVSERIGAPVGSAFVRTETAGDSLVKHVFIGKFENHALRFSCIFYKPRDEWLVNAVHWDDQTQALF